jgi:hypothetical protein
MRLGEAVKIEEITALDGSAVAGGGGAEGHNERHSMVSDTTSEESRHAHGLKQCGGNGSHRGGWCGRVRGHGLLAATEAGFKKQASVASYTQSCIGNVPLQMLGAKGVFGRTANASWKQADFAKAAKGWMTHRMREHER